MLTADHLRLMGQILDKTIDRAIAKDEDGVTLDHAAFEAITAVVGGFLRGEEDQDPATVEVMLTATLELLHELPIPTEEGGFVQQLGRHSGARR